MKRWSKLRKLLYGIIAKNIDLQIHCSVYRMQSQRGSTNLPRYWITLNKEIIFDYSKQFTDTFNLSTYPYKTEISEISDPIREYLYTPSNYW